MIVPLMLEMAMTKTLVKTTAMTLTMLAMMKMRTLFLLQWAFIAKFLFTLNL